jgi:hypothetical protein
LSTEKSSVEQMVDKIRQDRDRIKKAQSYYGIKYGTFSWVRGTIEIYDLDDLDYIKICMDKMGERFLNETKEKKKKLEH